MMEWPSEVMMLTVPDWSRIRVVKEKHKDIDLKISNTLVFYNL